MKKIALAFFASLLAATVALAQGPSGGGSGPGPVPDPWTVTGNTITSNGLKILAPAPTTAQAGFSMGYGVAPTSPVNGDWWCTVSGCYYQANGATVGPIVATSVSGPGSSTAGCAAPWSNTSGSLLANNCAFSLSGAVATVTGGLTFSPGQNLSISPTGNPTGGSILTTFSSFNVQGSAVSSTNREFLVSCGLTSATGSGIIGTINDGKVCGYFGIVGNAGTGSLWALNSVTQLSASSGSYSAHGYEADINNLVADRLATTNSFSLANPFVAGVDVSGDTVFRSTYAFVVGGSKWQYAFAAFGDTSDSAFYEATNPGSTYGLNLQGAHTYGIFVNSAAAVNILNGPLATNNGAQGIISGASLDVRSGANERIIFRGPETFGSGNSIYSVNDAGNATVLLEIGAAGVLFSGVDGVTNGGPFILDGSSTGAVTIAAQAAAGTYNFNLPTTAGTSGYVLTSAGGSTSPMTWTQISGIYAPLASPGFTGTVSFPDGSTFSSGGLVVSGNLSGTNSIFPNVLGGTLVSSTLTLESTSVSGSSDAIIFKTGNAVEAGRILTNQVWKFGSASFTANGSTTLALSNIGPTGAHATVQEWFTLEDSSGTTRYIPAF